MPNTPTLPTEQPTLDEDLSVLAWLQFTRDPLSPACTSHPCGALLECSMTGVGQSCGEPPDRLVALPLFAAGGQIDQVAPVRLAGSSSPRARVSGRRARVFERRAWVSGMAGKDSGPTSGKSGCGCFAA